MSSLSTFSATAPQPPASRTVRRTIAILVLFVASLALGVGIHVAAATPAAPTDRFPTIAHGPAAEPPIAAAITVAIGANDPRALASAYSAELLQGFKEAMAPVDSVDEIRYAGGVERDGETLASYVAAGKDQNGQAVISGFVVHVQDGQITGFN
jgi:hypothetical protein